ncbi:MAG: alpha-ketoglutarate-dependent dioxygenase AlkB family protein [Actinomycetota bacterium]
MKLDDFTCKQLSLFDNLSEEVNRNQGQVFSLPDAEIVLYRNFFNKDESSAIFTDLYENIQWEQESAFLYGKKVVLPRLTAWYGDRGKIYTYSKIRMDPNPWTSNLEYIKSQTEGIHSENFNSVLLNLYRDNSDSIAWHSDDEKELGENPTIASLSFGETRSFMLRHKFKKELKISFKLTHGSLLIMGGTTQHYWQHQVPKTRSLIKPRINLTFRKILG